MNFYETLLRETAGARADFMAIPILRRAIESGVDRDLYLRYLSQAYHHVRHTCALLALAAARCGVEDRAYQAALFDYIDEEKGHDEWILDDIRDLGGDAALVRDSVPGPAVQVMIGYAYYAVEHVSPYALLGMVHVLEGMSVALAEKAAQAIEQSLGLNGAKGFRYLTSHGALDQDHIRFFADLVNGIDRAGAKRAIVDTANIMYRLFGDVFRELDTDGEGSRHAA